MFTDYMSLLSAHLVTVGGVTPDHLTQILLDLGPVVTNLHNLRGHWHGHHACNTRIKYHDDTENNVFLRWQNCLCLPPIWATLHWPQDILHLLICFSRCMLTTQRSGKHYHDSADCTQFIHIDLVLNYKLSSAFFCTVIYDLWFVCFCSWIIKSPLSINRIIWLFLIFQVGCQCQH